MGYSNDKMRDLEYFMLGTLTGFMFGAIIGMGAHWIWFKNNRALARQRLGADATRGESIEMAPLIPPANRRSTRSRGRLAESQAGTREIEFLELDRAPRVGGAPAPTPSPTDRPAHPFQSDVSASPEPRHSDTGEILETDAASPIPSTNAAFTGERSDLTQNLLHTLEAPRATGPASMPSGAQGGHAGRVSYRRGERGLEETIDLGLDVV